MIGSMSFFCALVISQWIVTPPAVSLTNTSSLRQTGLSLCSSEKNSWNDEPSVVRMSSSVESDGEVWLLSSWEMNPLDSSQRSASSFWVRLLRWRRLRSFSPMFIVQTHSFESAAQVAGLAQPLKGSAPKGHRERFLSRSFAEQNFEVITANLIKPHLPAFVKRKIKKTAAFKRAAFYAVFSRFTLIFSDIA